MGFTGLIWQLKKLKFLHFPRIWTNSLNEDAESVSAQLRDKNKAKKQYWSLFQGNDPTSKSPHKKYDHMDRW